MPDSKPDESPRTVPAPPHGRIRQAAIDDDRLHPPRADRAEPGSERNRPGAMTLPAVVAERMRQRLTVREMQIALDAARTVASGSADADPCAQPGTGIVDTVDAGSAADSRNPRSEPWLPEHDGPVSLAGATAPCIRTARTATATRGGAASRPEARRTTDRVPTTAALDPTLASAAVAAPPRLVVVPACGGAGASTATVLLAAALAPVTGALLIAGGADRGSLCVRADAHGGDIAALTAWAAGHAGQPLRPTTPGLARGDAGTGPLGVAAAGRDDSGRPFDPDIASALLAAPAPTRTAVLLDWSCVEVLPEQVCTGATHLLVVAPATSPGLLDAEYLVQSLAAAVRESASLSVLTVDVRGRSPRRAGRAALARLRALDLPLAALPYDPALADDPRVRWPMLRRRTRTAVVATLTHVLHGRRER